MDIRTYIEIDSNKRFGKPRLIGTRITVLDVLNWLANGMSKEAIVMDYPELDEQKILACLHYAASRESQLGYAS